MTPKLDLEAAAKIADGFRGRFFFDCERGDLAFIAEACDDGRCDCPAMPNSDGDQDCSVSVGDMDGDIDDVGEPIAAMLNALPAALAEIRELRAQAARYAWATPAANVERPAGCRCDLWTRGHCRQGCPSEATERDTLRAQLATAIDERDHARGARDFQLQCALKMQAEKDAARAELHALMAKTIAHPMAVVVETETAEQIAAWLETTHRLGSTGNVYARGLAHDIRSGAWRGK